LSWRQRMAAYRVGGMRKLEKREGFIIGAMAIAVLYGALTFLIGGQSKKAVSPATINGPDLQVLTSDITATVSKQAFSVRDAYVIAKAETEWLHDPFMGKKVYRQMVTPIAVPKAAEVAPVKIAFNYMGYMEFRGKQIAIINGVEYTLGESLDTPGYVLRSISPQKVIIENKGGQGRIEVPIQD